MPKIDSAEFRRDLDALFGRAYDLLIAATA
jgi:hypothetical protein